MPKYPRFLVALRGGRDYHEWLLSLSAALIRDGVHPALAINPHALAEHALAELGRQHGLGDPPPRAKSRGRAPRNVPPPDSIGAVLRTRRLAAGLTQAQVAERLGIRPTHYAMWERGRHRPSQRYLEPLRLILDPPP